MSHTFAAFPDPRPFSADLHTHLHTHILFLLSNTYCCCCRFFCSIIFTAGNNCIFDDEEQSPSPFSSSASAVDIDDDILFDCEVGITDVDCAIAESGSLVVSTNGRIRNAWITPPIHIAIVRASQILPDLVDLFESRPDALDAASTTVITGPSKTADIEGVLVTGVHGPAAVEVVLIG